MVIKYNRPSILSNPELDFTTEELAAILSKKDKDFGHGELACIFQSYCRAGYYNEVCYFVPVALDFIVKDHEDSPSIADYFLEWFFHNKKNLENDGYYEDIIKFFETQVKIIIKKFNLSANADNHLYPNGLGLLFTIIEQFYEKNQFRKKNHEYLIDE